MVKVGKGGYYKVKAEKFQKDKFNFYHFIVYIGA